jgi:hypothetical protein
LEDRLVADKDEVAKQLAHKHYDIEPGITRKLPDGWTIDEEYPKGSG